MVSLRFPDRPLLLPSDMHLDSVKFTRYIQKEAIAVGVPPICTYRTHDNDQSHHQLGEGDIPHEESTTHITGTEGATNYRMFISSCCPPVTQLREKIRMLNPSLGSEIYLVVSVGLIFSIQSTNQSYSLNTLIDITCQNC